MAFADVSLPKNHDDSFSGEKELGEQNQAQIWRSCSGAGPVTRCVLRGFFSFISLLDSYKNCLCAPSSHFFRSYHTAQSEQAYKTLPRTLAHPSEFHNHQKSRQLRTINMNPSDRLSGTTLHPGNLSQSSSARSPRDGTPAGHRDRMTHATDYERVPVEENGMSYLQNLFLSKGWEADPS